MSHFTVAVITETPENLEKLLAPYQENNMGDCPKEYLQFFDMEEENKDEYENGIVEKIKLADGKYINTWDYKGDKNNLTQGISLVEVPFKEIYPTFEGYITDWCGYTKRNEETGKYGYWENPNKEWDWYEVGGRWNGLIKLKNGDEVDLAQFKDIDLPDDFGTYAVITPDGKWHSKGQMGWWGMSSETDEKSKQFNQSYHEKFIATANPDHFIIIVDCHI